MLTALLLTGLTLGAASAAPDVVKPGTKNCTAADLKQAQEAFGKYLNLSKSYDWNHPFDLLDGIHKFYAGDAERGLLDMCNAFNVLLDFLNNKDVFPPSCFEPRFLLAEDDLPDNAIHYLGVVGLLRFQCGAGFYAAASRWACLAETYKANPDLPVRIRQAAQQGDNEPLRRCHFAKQSEALYVKPFQDHCHNGAVTYFACESYNRFFGTMFSECLSECKSR